MGFAVDEGENVGWGSATPICFSRAEKPSLKSSGSGCAPGLMESERIAAGWGDIEVSDGFGGEKKNIGQAILPSSLVKEALGWVGCAEGAALLDTRGGGGGGVAPGVLVGNLRAPFCAAFEVDEPIVPVFSCLLYYPHKEQLGSILER